MLSLREEEEEEEASPSLLLLDILKAYEEEEEEVALREGRVRKAREGRRKDRTGSIIIIIIAFISARPSYYCKLQSILNIL